MDRYLLAMGTQDKPTCLWQVELFYYTYQKYIDKSVYDIHFYIASWDKSPKSEWLERLISAGLPITFTPDYSTKLGQDGVDNKYLTVYHHGLNDLDGRHLIIIDTDVLLLPKFNEYFRLAPTSILAFEVNEIHRNRVEPFLAWYNGFYHAQIEPQDCLIAPSLIINSAFVKDYLTRYFKVIHDCPDSWMYGAIPQKTFKRHAVMCGKGAIQSHYNYSMNRIPMFLNNMITIPSRDNVFDYANLHYWGKSELFNKRSYRDKTPFEAGAKPWNKSGYHASSFIWETIDEYKKAGRYGL